MMADILQIRSGGAWGRKHLSVQYLMSCWDGHSGCKIGGSPEDAYNLKQLTRDGVPLESDFPYTASDKTPCREIPAETIRIRTIKGTYRDLCKDPSTVIFGSKWDVINANIRRMKEAIVNNGPIVGTLRVHKDLYDYRSDGVYKLTPGSPLVGMHAVEIVGWSNKGVNWKEDGFDEAYWIVRSSWGLGYPVKEVPHGYCYIRMGFNEIDIESRSSTCDIEIPDFLKEAVSKADPFDSAYTDYDNYVDDPEREAYLGAVEKVHHFKAKRSH
jgi:Papain family cysteine protease